MPLTFRTLVAGLVCMLPGLHESDPPQGSEHPLALGKLGPARVSLTQYLKSKGVRIATTLAKGERDLVLDYLEEEIESWSQPEARDALALHERTIEGAWLEGKRRGRSVYSLSCRDGYWARRMDHAKQEAFLQGKFHVVREGSGKELWSKLASEQEMCSHVFVYLEGFRFGRGEPFEVILMIAYEDQSEARGQACCASRKGFVDLAPPVGRTKGATLSLLPPLAQYSSLWFMPNLQSTCGRKLDEHAKQHQVSVTSVYCKLLINRMGARVAGKRMVFSGGSTNLSSADHYEVGKPVRAWVQGKKRRLNHTVYKWTQTIEEGRVPMALHLYRPAAQAAQAGPTRMSEDSILGSSSKLDSIRFRRARDWVFWSAPLNTQPRKTK